jgi:CubicO group peptidase (beta-lactamase class C family)
MVDCHVTRVARSRVGHGDLALVDGLGEISPTLGRWNVALFRMLGWVYERACGMSCARILSHFLSQPIGAEHDAYITVDARGAARVAGAIRATAQDLARFGEMMHNTGISDGRQVVPSWWIDDIRRNGDAEAWSRGELTKVLPDGNYRSQWYTVDRDEAPSAAVSIHGQWIYIGPANDTVIIRVSPQPLPMDLDPDCMCSAAIVQSRSGRERLMRPCGSQVSTYAPEAEAPPRSEKARETGQSKWRPPRRTSAQCHQRMRQGSASFPWLINGKHSIERR